MVKDERLGNIGDFMNIKPCQMLQCVINLHFHLSVLDLLLEQPDTDLEDLVKLITRMNLMLSNEEVDKADGI